MNPRTPPHPFGHGRPPTESELARFREIVADLAGENVRTSRRRPVAADLSQRVRRLYAWCRVDESRGRPAATDRRDPGD